MFRTCIVDLAAWRVVNIVEYEELQTGMPPGMEGGFLAVPSESAQIGWAWDGTALSDPVPPAAEASPQDKIAQLLAQHQIGAEWQLLAMMAGLISLAATQGVSEPQLYAENPGYKQAKDLEQQIAALRSEIR